MTQTLSRRLKIKNERGLHARASAKFSETAGRYDAVVQVSSEGETVGADSIMGLMMLSAGPGAVIEVTAEGAAADDALDALEALVDDLFGEEC